MRRITKEELREWSVKDSERWKRTREQLDRDKENRKKILRKESNEKID